MADAAVKWHGDKLLVELADASQEGLLEIAKELVETAADKAPRRRGDLAKSGYAAIEGASTYRKAKNYRKEIKVDRPGIAIAAFAIFYAGFQEYGTHRQAAQPFLRPALDEGRDRLGAKFVTTVKGRLR